MIRKGGGDRVATVMGRKKWEWGEGDAMGRKGARVPVAL